MRKSEFIEHKMERNVLVANDMGGKLTMMSSVLTRKELKILQLFFVEEMTQGRIAEELNDNRRRIGEQINAALLKIAKNSDVVIDL